MKPLSEIRANAPAQDPQVRQDLARIITKARMGSEGLKDLHMQLQIANYKHKIKSSELPDTVSGQMAPHLYLAAKRLVREHFLREVKEDLDTNSGLSNASGMSTTGAGVELDAAPKKKIIGGVKKLKPVTYSSRTGNGG